MLQAVDGEKDRLVATLLPHVLRLGKEVKFLETLKQAAKPMVTSHLVPQPVAQRAGVLRVQHQPVRPRRLCRRHPPVRPRYGTAPVRPRPARPGPGGPGGHAAGAPGRRPRRGCGRRR